MKISDFFDNLNVYFEADEDNDDMKGSEQAYSFVYRNGDGEVYEVRIFNPEYKEIMSISRDGQIEIISVEDK